MNYLPKQTSLPVLAGTKEQESISERDLLYKVLFDMKKDIMELRKTVNDLTNGQVVVSHNVAPETSAITQIRGTVLNPIEDDGALEYESAQDADVEFVSAKPIIDSLSLQDKEKEIIIKALRRYNGRRRAAAAELGISERTLYRKINDYGIDI